MDTDNTQQPVPAFSSHELVAAVKVLRQALRRRKTETWRHFGADTLYERPKQSWNYYYHGSDALYWEGDTLPEVDEL